MESTNLNYKLLLDHFIANSIFTEKQTSIIYNKMLNGKPADYMTSGAYYRQLGQCRNKTTKVLYTLLLLRLLNAIDTETFSVLRELNNQLNVMLNKRSDEIHTTVLNDVTLLIDNVIKKLILL